MTRERGGLRHSRGDGKIMTPSFPLIPLVPRDQADCDNEDNPWPLETLGADVGEGRGGG